MKLEAIQELNLSTPEFNSANDFIFFPTYLSPITSHEVLSEAFCKCSTEENQLRCGVTLGQGTRTTQGSAAEGQFTSGPPWQHGGRERTGPWGWQESSCQLYHFNAMILSKFFNHCNFHTHPPTHTHPARSLNHHLKTADATTSFGQQ